MKNSAEAHKTGRTEEAGRRTIDGAAFKIRPAKGGGQIKSALCAVLITATLLLFMGCTKKARMYKESRILMDTYCTITVISRSKENAGKAIEAGFAEIKKLELLLNYFSDTSEISAVNRAAGIRPVRVSEETMEIMRKTVEISRLTGGAFDATIAPVVRLWTFSGDTSGREAPSGQAVEEALRLVDYRKIDMNETTRELFLREKGMEIDLGGIAKGYGADKALEAIRAAGIDAALVAIAGDIRGYGVNLSGQGWNVGVQNPRPELASDKPWEDIFAVLHLHDQAISTSGDYQRFFISNGRRYHHILSPETGFSAESGLISASVIAPEGYLADSLSTAVFVMGAGKGMKFLESLGLDGVLVDSEKRVMFTKNLKGNIEILNKSYPPAE